VCNGPVFRGCATVPSHVDQSKIVKIMNTYMTNVGLLLSDESC
jgi:hypothetical protein